MLGWLLFRALHGVPPTTGPESYSAGGQSLPLPFPAVSDSSPRSATPGRARASRSTPARAPRSWNRQPALRSTPQSSRRAIPRPRTGFRPQSSGTADAGPSPAPCCVTQSTTGLIASHPGRKTTCPDASGTQEQATDSRLPVSDISERQILGRKTTPLGRFRTQGFSVLRPKVKLFCGKGLRAFLSGLGRLGRKIPEQFIREARGERPEGEGGGLRPGSGQ